MTVLYVQVILPEEQYQYHKLTASKFCETRYPLQLNVVFIALECVTFKYEKLQYCRPQFKL